VLPVRFPPIHFPLVDFPDGKASFRRFETIDVPDR